MAWTQLFTVLGSDTAFLIELFSLPDPNLNPPKEVIVMAIFAADHRYQIRTTFLN